MTIQARLKIMSFLQFFIWGSWLITLGSYMIKTLLFSGTQVGDIYSMQGIAACIMPLFIGIIADKYISANRLYIFCHCMGAVMLVLMAETHNPTIMMWLMLVNFIVYIPSLGLCNSITHFCLKQNGLDTAEHFPVIRIFATLGFIAAMWVVSLSKLELSAAQLYIAAAASVCLALYSLTLPFMPISKTADETSDEAGVIKHTRLQKAADFFGLDVFALLKHPQMSVFFVFAILLGVVLNITNTFGNPFLHDLAATPQAEGNILLRYPDILYSLSQISELACLLAIPFFLRRFGIKVIMAISALAWVLRFGLFAFSDASFGGTLLLVLSMLVYGCAFDFFMTSGSIFMEQETGDKYRSRAQGLFMAGVNGFGTFIGMYLGGRIIDLFTAGNLRDWRSIWLIFSAYTLVLFVVFLLAFRDKKTPARVVEKALPR